MKWTPFDILDLDYLLRLDSDQDATILTKRDRNLFLEISQAGSNDTPSAPPDTTAVRRSLLFRWIECRKEQLASFAPASFFPGQVVADSFHMCTLILSLLGIGFGVSLALVLLAYTGSSPINVFTYLLVLIIPQILLVLGIVLASSSTPYRAGGRRHPLLLLIGKFISAISRRLGTQCVRTLSPDKKDAFLSTLGQLSIWNKQYGRLFFHPTVATFQYFGITFNIGALGATIVKVMGSDLAFGWQSTLSIGPQAAYNLVTTIALPWSWLVPSGLAHPTLDQIAGSKMVLKEGIYHLTTPDLVSWWPFLCFAVLTYGLLPRILLYAWSRYRAKQCMAAHPFAASDIDRLFYRMTIPLVETTPRALKPDTNPTPPPPPPSPAPPTPKSQNTIREQQVMLIPDEIIDDCPLDQLYQQLHQKTGIRPSSHFPLDPYDPGTCLAHLEPLAWKDNRPRITIIQEAWQPPIREDLDLLKTLATSPGPSTTLTIALIGKPQGRKVITPADKADLTVWKNRVAQMALPNIDIIELGTSHDA
ncbi:DUF2868 domain-containing protein [Desulfoplanes sp.]